MYFEKKQYLCACYLDNMNKSRYFIGIFVAAIALVISSCSKEVITTSRMESFYSESQGLPQCTIDSIKTFTSKFSSYVGSYPESRQDELFEPTVDNIRNACALHGYKLVEVNVGITINDEWLPDTIIYF